MPICAPPKTRVFKPYFGNATGPTRGTPKFCHPVPEPLEKSSFWSESAMCAVERKRPLKSLTRL